MKNTRQKAFEDVNGTFTEREGERTCAIRLPPTTFFEGEPPVHQRLDNEQIPSHITYAYKKGAKIMRNDDFYPFPESGTKEVDLLFIIANAPVKTGSMANAGSESYVGLASAMELTVYELSE